MVLSGTHTFGDIGSLGNPLLGHQNHMSNQLIEYRSVLHLNGEVFLFNYKDEFAAFGVTDEYFDAFAKTVSTKHMKNGKTLIGLIPLLMIMQRLILPHKSRQSVKHVFVYHQIPSVSDSQWRNAAVDDCNRPQCTQRSIVWPGTGWCTIHDE